MIPRILLLASLLALGVLLLDFGDEPEGLRPAGAPEPPRYYLREASVTDFDAAGAVRYEMNAERAVEEPGSGRVLLEGVALDYLAEPARRWHVTAARGTLEPDAASIELEGDVELTGRGPERGPPAVLRSPRLSFDSQTQLATTRDQVELDFGRHVLRARGLSADLKGGTLRLESRVNGRFLP